ncbi:MAG: hypothetical protein ACTTIC_06525 [Helicobacteraceae bacterium]
MLARFAPQTPRLLDLSHLPKLTPKILQGFKILTLQDLRSARPARSLISTRPASARSSGARSLRFANVAKIQALQAPRSKAKDLARQSLKILTLQDLRSARANTARSLRTTRPARARSLRSASTAKIQALQAPRSKAKDLAHSRLEILGLALKILALQDLRSAIARPARSLSSTRPAAFAASAPAHKAFAQ